MIERYNISEIERLFSDKNRFSIYLKIEGYLLSVINKSDPTFDLSDYWKIKIDVKEIKEEEKKTSHDVFAFINVITKKLNTTQAKYFHFGLTSTDLVDTTNSLIIKDAFKVIKKDIFGLFSILDELSLKYKNLNCLSRTHGQDAQVSRFGLKFHLALENLKVIYKALENSLNLLTKAKLSGPSGNFQDLSFELAQELASNLGLKLAINTTQVLPRYLFSQFFFNVINFNNELSRLANDLRLLSMSSILEVSEGFTNTQRGSSAMPQKRNPINLEQIMGLSRYSSSLINVFLENNLLWLERDISHSSNERIIIGDNLILLSYLTRKFTKILKNLNVYPQNIQRNIEATYYTCYSSQVMNHLIKVKNYDRTQAYDLVKHYCELSLHKEINLFTLLENDDIINRGEVEAITDNTQLEQGVNQIYRFSS